MVKRQARGGGVPTDQAGSPLISAEKALELRRKRELGDVLKRLRPGDRLPDWSDMALADRFSVVLRTLPVDCREALGKSDTQLSRYEKGAEIPFNVIAALARETELPIEWIATGEPNEPETLPEDVSVQKLAFQASAGTGSLVIDDLAASIAFPISVLNRVNVKASNARVLEASGESMKSTINDGDLLLVDISDNTIAEGKVYVFSIGDEVFVKRLRRTAERVMVRADNQELYPGEEPVPVGIPFRVYGRVKWAGRTL